MPCSLLDQLNGVLFLKHVLDIFVFPIPMKTKYTSKIFLLLWKHFFSCQNKSGQSMKITEKYHISKFCGLISMMQSKREVNL